MKDPDFLIAVTQNDQGELSSVPETQKIMFFHKGPSDWQIDQVVDFNFANITGLAEMRKKLKQMAGLLCQVQALVSRGYGGLSLEVLSKFDFSLYQLNGFKTEVLSAIAENDLSPSDDQDPAQTRAKPQESSPDQSPPKAPYETEFGSGEFFLDMRLALNSYPELTSKKILRPFFESQKFLSLKLIFDHFPPWLPDHLKARGLSWDHREIPGGLLIEITSEIAKPCHQLSLK
ncbi:MAG: hypothetical protein LBE80_06735 [Deltaproteobacteria bacterium]|jgi:Fe-only nitrogenase accessory protein AnfO|nr:hypothetical protein [Deltaproteobacteria bacterium]